ncbi:unnamed protein product [Caenorhabditis auriculariae]|uniref:Methyltransferase FkbM domain-containing protein n=1 Tax=Caenorhabditis auriculariae TaxID=2777116 RepID=A0A8S1H188_9PELO|nr:unnamed protein product [Caenorhabditis auriculariae]
MNKNTIDMGNDEQEDVPRGVCKSNLAESKSTPDWKEAGLESCSCGGASEIQKSAKIDKSLKGYPIKAVTNTLVAFPQSTATRRVSRFEQSAQTAKFEQLLQCLTRPRKVGTVFAAKFMALPFLARQVLFFFFVVFLLLVLTSVPFNFKRSSSKNEESRSFQEMPISRLPVFSDSFREWRECFSQKLKDCRKDPEKMWYWVRSATNQCQNKTSFSNIVLTGIKNKDEMKYHVYGDKTPGVVVTLGIGLDVKAETKLKETLPKGTKFFSADPIFEGNSDLYAPIGTYFPFAVGHEIAVSTANVLHKGKYKLMTMPHIDIITFLTKFVNETKIDQLLMDNEGAEYNILPMMGKDGEFDRHGIVVCQINTEIHDADKSKKEKFLSIMNQIIDDGRYAFLVSYATVHHRFFIINAQHPYCVQKFFKQFYDSFWETSERKSSGLPFVRVSMETITQTLASSSINTHPLFTRRNLEPWLTKSHKNHNYVETEKGIPASAYYLLGSFSTDGDYHIAHITKCPVPASALAEGADSNSKTLDDVWIADNAERVLRILPGGINVLGIAWFSSKSFFTQHKNVITRALVRIQRMSNALTTMNQESLGDTMVTVFVDNADMKPSGFVIDAVGKNPDVSTKVAFQKLEWVSLVSNASARIVFNVPPRKENRSDFYNDFVAASKTFTTNLFTCQYVILDGVLREDSEPLFKDIKKRKKNAVEAQIFLDPLYNRQNEQEEQRATNLHEILFDIEIRASVPVRATVREAKKAMKHHLIRNLCSRAELQYESMEIVEECPTPCVVHQLPRPATTVLPTQSAILLSDFLFEADTIEDAQKNFEDMMDIQTSIEHVDEGWERALTEEEMASIRTPLDVSIAEYEIGESYCNLRNTLIIAAIAVALLSFIIYVIVANT